MCLIVFAWKLHPEHQLIVAANRDEFHARPSQEAHWWPDDKSILAGRDLQAGGTWLGVSRSGRFAAVTNYRERQQRKAAAHSRGDLVAGFLRSEQSPDAFAGNIQDASFAGFSLLLADREQMICVSNRETQSHILEPGLYGLSNASLDTPWPKLLRSKKALQALLDCNNVNITELLRLLGDRSPAAIDDVEADDLPFELARSLTAPFIVTEEYGTRCSTVLLAGNDGRMELAERSFASSGQTTGDQRFTFSTPSQD